MLVLGRKVNEAIRIGRDVRVTVVKFANGMVRLGVDAPRNVEVLREELYQEQHEAEGGDRDGVHQGGMEAQPPIVVDSPLGPAGETSWTN